MGAAAPATAEMVEPAAAVTDLLSVADVMARYGLRDRRAARKLMDEVGSFVIASNIYVRTADLLAHEDALKAARKARNGLSSARDRSPRPAHRKPPAPRAQPLAPGWWRTANGEGGVAPPNPRR